MKHCILFILVILIFLVPITLAQKMTVKDSDTNILMEVNDEGSVGSITIPPRPSKISTETNKLYNLNSLLIWNGDTLNIGSGGGSTNGWTDGGVNIYTTTSTDKVGIGTNTPEFLLSLDSDGGILAKGSYGSGTILNTSGAGTRMIWYPRKAAFRAGQVDDSQWDDGFIADYSIAMGFNTTALEDFSLAMGSETTASGLSSTAMGHATTASGVISTAMGNITRAVGESSTAMGFNTDASGVYSTAMGFSTNAESYNVMVIGRYNVGGGNANNWISTDPLFEIGIGADMTNKENAVTVLKNGNVGLGTTTPEFKLSLDEDGGILAEGIYGSGTELNRSGAGTRLIWYPNKSAFRVGRISGSQWDDTNIGHHSTAIGFNSTASNDYTTAMGYETTANGRATTALGLNTTATAFGSTVIGRYNVGGGTTNSWISAEPVFEIGIGSDASNKVNAVTVLKNGHVGIGITTPMELLEVNGAIKLGITSNTHTGTIRWSGSDFEGYNGSTWESLTARGASDINGLSDGRTGGNSVFLGSGAGANDDETDNQNTAVGINALNANTTGFSNTASGYCALNSNTTGSGNTACGFEALYSTIGYDNTASGSCSLENNTTGYANTASGSFSLNNNTTGDYNTALGFRADVLTGNLYYATAIGANAFVNASYKVVIGSSSVISIGGYADWTNFSDRRFKENIVYQDNLGLDFIMKLNTVSFNYKDDENRRRRDGLIAQDVEAALKELSMEFSGLIIDDDEQKTMNLAYDHLVLPLINAVKEQQKIIDDQQKRIEKLEVRCGICP